jgi:hypothetical protein
MVRSPTYLRPYAPPAQALKFGAGAAIKSGTPIWWPELARDAVSGGLSAAFSTTLLFPLDTLKTRMQLGQQMSVSPCVRAQLSQPPSPSPPPPLRVTAPESRRFDLA